MNQVKELRLDSWWLHLKSQNSIITERIIKPEKSLSKFSVIGTSLLLKLVRCNYQQPLCNCQVTNLHLEETTWNDLSSFTVYQAQWIYSQASQTKQYPKPDSQNQSIKWKCKSKHRSIIQYFYQSHKTGLVVLRTWKNLQKLLIKK